MGSVIKRIKAINKETRFNIIVWTIVAFIIGSAGWNTFRPKGFSSIPNGFPDPKATQEQELKQEKRTEELKQRYYQHIEETGGWGEYWKTGHWKDN